MACVYFLNKKENVFTYHAYAMANKGLELVVLDYFYYSSGRKMQLVLKYIGI